MVTPRAVTVLPSGEVTSTPPQRPASSGSPSPSQGPASPVADVEIDESGRIAGVDGVLNQVAEALARQAGPMLRNEILPVLQRDRAMQRTIGAAAGAAIGRKLAPYAALSTLALVVIAGLKAKKYLDARRDAAAFRSAMVERDAARPQLPEGRKTPQLPDGRGA